MRWLFFLSRVAFICNVFFVVAVSLQLARWFKNEEAESLIIILGYFMAIVCNSAANLCYLYLLLLKSRNSKPSRPGCGWLISCFFFFSFTLFFTYMVNNLLRDKPAKLFVSIAAFFVANALIAEVIGTKIFSLEKLFGLRPVSFSMFGEDNLSFNLTCGVLLWPLEFIITDIVNEYYGPKAVRRISFTAIALISYAFLMYFMAIGVPPADFWLPSGKASGVADMQVAFSAVFGQGMRIIIGSIVAFGVSQLVDVYVFHKIKKATGNGRIWLRATGSTLISQLIDSYIVLFIAFSGVFSWQQILAFGMMNYCYKAFMALALTPVIVLAERRIEKYLGKSTAAEMKRQAMGEEPVVAATNA